MHRLGGPAVNAALLKHKVRGSTPHGVLINQIYS